MTRYQDKTNKIVTLGNMSVLKTKGQKDQYFRTANEAFKAIKK
jgi:hypothetical protein